MTKTSAPTYSQAYYRFRDNVPDPTGVDAAFDAGDTAENNGATITTDSQFRLRIAIEQTNAEAYPSTGDLTTEFLLQYNHEGGGYNTVTGSTPVQFALCSGFANHDNTTTKRLSSANTLYTGDGLEVSGATDTIAMPELATSVVELEFSLTIDSGQVSDTDTIDFRILYSASDESPPATTMTYTVTPTLTVSAGAVTHQASATLNGVGTVAAVGKNARYGTVTMVGAGTVAAIGKNARYGTVTMAGAGTVAAAGQNRRLGKTTMAGAGTLTSNGQLLAGGSTTLAGVGSVAAAGTTYGIRYGTVTMAGAGTVAANAQLLANASATLAGVGSVQAIGTTYAGVVHYGTATLAGVGTLDAIGLRTHFGTVTMAGVGTLDAIGTLITTYYGTATLAGIGTILAVGTLVSVTPEKLGGDDEKEKPEARVYERQLLELETVFQRPADPLFEMRMRQKQEMEAKDFAAQLDRQREEEAARRVDAYLRAEKEAQDKADRARAARLTNLAKAQIALEEKQKRQEEINRVRRKNLQKARRKLKRMRGKK
jgi:hypothetical protein